MLKLKLAVLTMMLVGSGQVHAQTISSFASSAPLSSPLAVTTDSGGNTYVANSQGNGVDGPDVIKVTPGGTTSVVYTPSGQVAFTGLAVDSGGNLYISDSKNNNITKVTPSGSPSVFFSGTAQSATSLGGITVDSSNNVYVGAEIAITGGTTGEIIKLTPAGSASVVPHSSGLGANGGLAFDSAGNLYSASAQFVFKFGPSGTVDTTFFLVPLPAFAQSLAVDGSGNVYVGYYYALPSSPVQSFIEKITPAGGGSVFDASNFVDPSGIAFTSSGNLLVADFSTNTLSSVTPSDTVSTVLGNGIADPSSIAFDASQNLYVAGTNSISKISPAGIVSTFVDASAGLIFPNAIAFDGSGNLFVGSQNGAIYKVTSSGTVSTFLAAGSITFPDALAFDTSGNLYVADGAGSTVSKITPAGSLTTFLPASAGLSSPRALSFDAAGNLYVAGAGTEAIVKVTQAGEVSSFVGASQGIGTPDGITFDQSGNLYVSNGNAIYAVSPAGVVSVVVQNTAGGTVPQLQGPTGLAFDGSGNLYVADPAINDILKVAFEPSPLAAAVLPGSRSVEVGAPATVFATVINSGSTDLDGCGAQLSATAPSTLTSSFQTTDSATNALTGTPNTPTTIKAGAIQTFLLAFQSSAPLTVPSLAPVFFCSNVTPAPATIGVDTLDLLFSATPIPDIIALAATATNDGTVHIANGAGAFAVATIDAGSAGTLTVTTDTGTATLPATTTICATNSSGQCLSPPAASVSVDYTANATPTFSVFVAASAEIPFAPGSSRIFVHFTDAGGVLHGATSVAVTTN